MTAAINAAQLAAENPTLAFLRRFIAPPLVRRRAMLACGFIGALTIVVTAPERREAAESWRLVIPGVPHPGGALFSALTFIAGMALLSLAWVRLVAHAVDRQVPARRRLSTVLVATLLWAAPIMLGPPLLSNDVYSYAAQGELASRGFDPAVVGPNALGGGPFMRAADSVWWNNPAPYGPIWNKIAEAVVVHSGHDPARAIWGFRLVAVVAVAIAGFFIYRLCRITGRDPSFALAMALANPVVLVHLVGGMHNEAAMLAIVLASIYALRRNHLLVAFALMVLAAAIKLPAAAGIAYIGWHSSLALRLRISRLFAAAFATATGMSLLVLTSFLTNSSLGWLGALRGTGKIKSTFAPPTMVGLFVSDVLGALGLSVDQDHTVALFRFTALAGAAALAFWLLRHSSRQRFELSLGLTMTLAVMFGPVLWPWYSTMAIVILAASGLERARMALCTWSIAIAMLVFPISVGTQLGLARFQSVLGLLLFAFIAVLSMSLQRLAGDPALPPRVRRLVRGLAPSPPPSSPELARL